MRLAGLLAIVAATGCTVTLESPGADASTLDAGVGTTDAGALDAGGIDAGGIDASAPLDAGPTDAIAPPGTVPGAAPAADGSQTVSVAPDAPAVFELVVAPGEHVGFFLRFDPATAGVVMHVDRWDGADVTELGLTDAGRGIRTLAVLETESPRTHWVRLEATATLYATLEVVRTPYRDGPTCEGDCERLLQLPLPVDHDREGYTWTPSTVMRYWFGRRDMLMMIRHASRAMADLGYRPVLIGDLSQWDGLTPGTDTGSLRHASHQRGKDVDITLYGLDGETPWRTFCAPVNSGSGRECTPGSAMGLDGRANATLYAGFLASGRVTMSFLDRELIPLYVAGAEEAAAAGAIAPALVPLYSDGVHLQHWPNHDNHIHVRISEEPYGGGGPTLAPAPFEPP